MAWLQPGGSRWQSSLTLIMNSQQLCLSVGINNLRHSFVVQCCQPAGNCVMTEPTHRGSNEICRFRPYSGCLGNMWHIVLAVHIGIYLRKYMSLGAEWKSAWSPDVLYGMTGIYSNRYDGLHAVWIPFASCVWALCEEYMFVNTVCFSSWNSEKAIDKSITLFPYFIGIYGRTFYWPKRQIQETVANINNVQYYRTTIGCMATQNN